MKSSELERIARIASIVRGGRARIDIGDDAAVVDFAGGPLVLTVDEQVEGTHFTRALCSFEDVGFRATMAAASDLAAMGARPVCALAAWVLPRETTDEDVEQIARGQKAACDAIGASVVGGNLARGPAVSIATTWVGTCEKPVARSGAAPGDGFYVCGDLGLASAGFRALSKGLADPPAEALAAWRRPRARIDDGLRMAKIAHACVDVSDGLASDARHLAEASGVRVVLDEAALRSVLHPAALAIAAALGEDAIDWALGGGEDYALLCASPAPIEGFVRIGAIEPGEGVLLEGRPVSGGFDHFR